MADCRAVDRKVPSVVVAAAYALAHCVKALILSVGDDDRILRPGDGQYIFWYRHMHILYIVQLYHLIRLYKREDARKMSTFFRGYRLKRAEDSGQ